LAKLGQGKRVAHMPTAETEGEVMKFKNDLQRLEV
jgi:hypothetical protein